MIGPEKITPLSRLNRGVPFLKTYSDSKTELQNLQILKMVLAKSSQFLSSKQPCELKSLDVALNIEGVEKIRLKYLRLRSTLEAIRLEF